jgi:hypothetical protein
MGKRHVYRRQRRTNQGFLTLTVSCYRKPKQLHVYRCEIFLKIPKSLSSQTLEIQPNTNLRHDFNDGEFVPELTYFVQDARYTKAARPAFGGDFFFEFRLLSSRSILFSVAPKYLRDDVTVAVPFHYEWERHDRTMIDHRIYYPRAALPAEARKQIGAP